MRKVGFVVLIAVSGFLGGAVCNLVLHGAPAAAQAGDAVPGVVRAKAFEVVDDAGTTRATLAVRPDGMAELRLSDAAGELRAGLGVRSDSSPGLALWDGAGQKRAELFVNDGGGPLLRLWDAAGEVRAMLTLLDGGAPNLTLWDAAGKRRAMLSVLDGSPRLSLSDAGEQTRAVFGCETTVNKRTGAEIKYPESTVTLFNADGEVLWQAP